MKNTTNQSIDIENSCCYTKVVTHLDNCIQQTNNNMLACQSVDSAQNNCDQQNLSEGNSSSDGGFMGYRVSHETKLVFVYGSDVPANTLKKYASNGYKIVTFYRGCTDVADVFRPIIFNRCLER